MLVSLAGIPIRGAHTFDAGVILSKCDKREAEEDGTFLEKVNETLDNGCQTCKDGISI